MAIKTIFTTDIDEPKGTNDQLEIFADDDGFLSIIIEDKDNDMCFCKLQINKESALLLLELLTKEIDLL